MSNIKSRDELQKMIGAQPLSKLSNGRVLHLNLPPARIISSQGLASFNYLIVTKQTLDNLEIMGNWNYVIFERCKITSCKFSGNFSQVYFADCNLANSDFTKANNITAEQVYTSHNLDQVIFADEDRFKSEISDLIDEERKTKQNNNNFNIIAGIAGDFSPIDSEYQKLIFASLKLETSNISDISLAQNIIPTIHTNKKKEQSL